jgi:hypothetical protein
MRRATRSPPIRDSIVVTIWNNADLAQRTDCHNNKKRCPISLSAQNKLSLLSFGKKNVTAHAS